MTGILLGLLPAVVARLLLALLLPERRILRLPPLPAERVLLQPRLTQRIIMVRPPANDPSAAILLASLLPIRMRLLFLLQPSRSECTVVRSPVGDSTAAAILLLLRNSLRRLIHPPAAPRRVILGRSIGITVPRTRFVLHLVGDASALLPTQAVVACKTNTGK